MELDFGISSGARDSADAFPSFLDEDQGVLDFGDPVVEFLALCSQLSHNGQKAEMLVLRNMRTGEKQRAYALRKIPILRKQLGLLDE